MKGLESRIKKLEETLGNSNDALGVIFITFVPAKDGRPDGDELYGYRWRIDGHEPIDTIRRAGERDSDLVARAKLMALPLGGIVLLHELRR